MSNKTRVINDVEMNGVMAGQMFITKLESGEYAAFNEQNEQVETSSTKSSLVKKYRPAKKKAISQAHAYVISLPITQRMPRGQLIVAAVENGQWSQKVTEFSSIVEMNKAASAVINRAATKKFGVTLCTNGCVHYGNLVSQVRRGDVENAVNYVLGAERRSGGQTQQTELPF